MVDTAPIGDLVRRLRVFYRGNCCRQSYLRSWLCSNAEFLSCEHPDRVCWRKQLRYTVVSEEQRVVPRFSADLKFPIPSIANPFDLLSQTGSMCEDLLISYTLCSKLILDTFASHFPPHLPRRFLCHGSLTRLDAAPCCTLSFPSVAYSLSRFVLPCCQQRLS